MVTDLQVYRYLRFKSAYKRRKRKTDGLRICMGLRLPFSQFVAINDRATWIGSFGPVRENGMTDRQYVRMNVFMVDFRAFYFFDGQYRCTKDRPLVRAWQKPGPKWRYRRCDDDPPEPARRVSINKRMMLRRKR
ncbi:hypothetical protein [Paraburkholderia sp. BCC1886]|uniref:hypothetical protein n=1 Tax=Paraburkholderia sp. BCC1886 TaxID=2562670 RepID=UPI001181E3C2|nr:hypothetical protein [Paraburkholderia sp. BCC1886]